MFGIVYFCSIKIFFFVRGTIFSYHVVVCSYTSVVLCGFAICIESCLVIYNVVTHTQTGVCVCVTHTQFKRSLLLTCLTNCTFYR